MRKEIREDVYRRMERLSELMDSCDYGDKDWEYYNAEYGSLARSIGIPSGTNLFKLDAVEQYMRNNKCPQCGGDFYKKKRNALTIHCRGCKAGFKPKFKKQA